MPSIITKLTQHASFIREVKEQIISEIVGQQASTKTSEGVIEGTVTTYNLQSEPEFGTAEGSGFEWAISFTAQGSATTGYKTSDSEDGETTSDGLCEGVVELTFPDDTLDTEDFEELASAVEITVTVQSWA